MMKKTYTFILCLSGFLLPAWAFSQQKPALNHIAIAVKDLAASTQFYQDIIGLDSIPEPFHDGKHTWFRIGAHSQLHLIATDNPIVVPGKDTHLCFSISSMDNFIQRLNRHHIEFSNWAGTAKAPAVRADGVKQLYLQDPDGYWVEINDDKF